MVCYMNSQKTLWQFGQNLQAASQELHLDTPVLAIVENESTLNHQRFCVFSSHQL